MPWMLIIGAVLLLILWMGYDPDDPQQSGCAFACLLSLALVLTIVGAARWLV